MHHYKKLMKIHLPLRPVHAHKVPAHILASTLSTGELKKLVAEMID
jgi:hypothetical protein